MKNILAATDYRYKCFGFQFPMGGPEGMGPMGPEGMPPVMNGKSQHGT